MKRSVGAGTWTSASDAERPLRCVHVITGLAVGGAERMLQKLIYATQGVELLNEVVCLSSEGAIGLELAASGVPVTYLRLSAVAPSPSGMLSLRRLLLRADADIVQTWMYHANLLGGLAMVGAGGPPLVWNVRASNLTNDEKLLTRLIARGSGLVARALCRRIVINSYNALEHHVRLGYPSGMFEVIPNGFDVEKFHPDSAARASVRSELGIPDEAPIIGIVARLHAMKGYPVFVAAAGQLAKVNADVHFVLVGKGLDESFVRELVKTRPELAGRLHALGPRQDVPRLVAAFDVYTSTSLYGEGFPNVLGEAMACGVPCVATEVGDSARIIGDTGIVVPTNDAAAVRSAWSRLLGEPAHLRQQRRARARVRVDEHYRLERIVLQYIELYRGLAATDNG